MFIERGIKKELIDDKSAEVMAEQVLAFVSKAFTLYQDPEAALEKKFNELTGELSPEDKKKVRVFIEGKKLFDHLFSMAEYEKVTNRRKDDRYHFPNYRDYEYAWSSVVPKESKKIEPEFREGAYKYAKSHMLADLVANELEKLKIEVNPGSINFINACNKVFENFEAPRKNPEEYIAEIAAILGNRGTIKKGDLRNQGKIKAAKRRPIFADQIQ